MPIFARILKWCFIFFDKYLNVANMIKLSDRINQLGESQTIAMSAKSRELKSQGHDVINLSVGEPDFFTPDNVKQAAKKAIDDNFSYYTAVNGFLPLREAITEKLKRDNGLDYEPSQIVVSTGAKQALMNAVLCLVNPGDEVIIPTPFWVSYSQMVSLSGGIPVYINAGIGKDFKITPEQLENAITSRSRLFIFSSPCNPSGSVYSKEELKSLVEVFEKHPDIIIISDEIYEYINFVGKHESIASFDSVKDRVVLVNGVSKGFAMTGWRLGYLAAHADIAKATTKLQGQFTSATSSITQMAVVEALRQPPESKMTEKFRERRDLVVSLLNEMPGVKANIPQGAFYVFPDMSSWFGKSSGDINIHNANDLCMYLLKEALVATVPGEAFGSPQCIRLSYATSNELLTKALKRIANALLKLK